GAVDLDQRPFGAPPTVMEDAGGEALAGPRLAADHQRGERHVAQLAEHLAHARRRRAATGEGIDRIAAVALSRLLGELALGAGAAGRAADDEVEPFLIAGLLEKIVGAEAQGA